MQDSSFGSHATVLRLSGPNTSAVPDGDEILESCEIGESAGSAAEEGCASTSGEVCREA